MVPQPVRVGVVATVLVALVVASCLLHLRVRNPDAGVVERMLEVAGSVPPDGTLAFVSSSPRRQARYAFHALRYAIAPRRLHRIEDAPHSDWLVVQGRLPAAEGYKEFRRFGAQLALWKRR